MTPGTEGVHEVVLNPGDFHFGGGHTRIATLLGSCVSITLWHPRRRIGGMCHYMLHRRPRPSEGFLDGRYAEEAFELFLQAVRKSGTTPEEYEAKIFGGGDMYVTNQGGNMGIGSRNIEAGHRFITTHGIRLLSEHVGGNGRRKLYFDLWSGDVWLAFRQGSGARIRKSDERKN